MSGLSDLIGGWVICAGLENTLTWPIGYIIIWVQVDGVNGYNEDQIALIVPHVSNFAAWSPCDPGNPHDRLHCECDKGEWDRHTGDVLGQHPCSLSSGCLMSDCHARKWQGHYQSTWSHWIWWGSHHQRLQNDWCLLIQNHTHINKDCIHQCKAECDDSHASKGLLPQVWWYRTPTQKCAMAARMLLLC